MAEKGGQTTQAGIDYQNKIATLFLGRLIDPGPWPQNEKIIAVRNEDPSAEVDDIVLRYEDHTVWIQVKLNMRDSGDTWVKFWKHMFNQWWQRPSPGSEQDRLVLAISQTPDWVKELEEICGRAYGSRTSPDLLTLEQQVAEWQNRLSESQKMLIDNLVADVSHLARPKKRSKQKPGESSISDEIKKPRAGDPIPSRYLGSEALFELFSHLEVWAQFNPDKIKSDHGRAYMPKSTQPWFNLFDHLYMHVCDHARYGKSISQHDLTQALNQSQIFIVGSTSLIPVPAVLPPQYIHRRGVEIPLVRCLRRKPDGAGPRIVGLVGNGGFGKTDLAKAAANDRRVLKKYPDGVLWVEIGQDPDLRSILENQIKVLTGRSPGFIGLRETGLNEAANVLADELRSRKLLIVLDDVWQKKLLEYFLPGAVQSAVLVTTRLPEIISRGESINVQEMENKEAARLLVSWMETPPRDLAPYSSLAIKLGEWPLLVKLAAGTLEEGVKTDGYRLDEALARLNERLDYYGLTAFDRTDEHDRKKAISISMNVSLERLENLDRLGNVRPRYLELAIFPEDVDIPFTVIEKLWKATAGMERIPVGDALHAMQRLSLFNRYDARGRTIRLHDVIRAYLEDQVGAEQVKAIHSRLLDGYGLENWAELPDDEPYLWSRLALHLEKAGRGEELYRLIGKAWMDTKFARDANHQSFSQDVEIAIRAAEEENNLPELARLCWLYARLGDLAANVPPEVLGILARCGQLEVSLGYAALIQKPKIQGEAYQQIVAGLLAAEQIQANTTALERVLQAVGVMKDAFHRTKALSGITQALTLAGYQVRSGEIARRALAAAEQVKDKTRAEALSEAAQALAQAGNLEGAQAAARNAVAEVEPKSMDYGAVRTLRQAAWVFAQVGDLEGIDQVSALGERFGDLQKRSNVLTRVAQALALVGERDRALKVAQDGLVGTLKINLESDKSNALFELAQTYAQIGDQEGVQSVLVVVENLDNQWDKERALGGVVQAFAALGDREGIRRVMLEAEGMSYLWHRSVALSEVAQAFAKVGDIQGVQQVLLRARQTSFVTKGERGGIESRRKIDEYDQVRALTGVAKALVAVGNREAAQDIAQLALAAAEKVQDSKGGALMMVMDSMALVGDLEGLSFVTQQAMAEAERMDAKWVRGRENKSTKAEYLSKVAQALVQVGDLQGAQVAAQGAVLALQTYGEDANKITQIDMGLTLAQALIQAGEREGGRKIALQALRVAEKIKDTEDKWVCVAGGSQVLARAGDRDSARKAAWQVMAYMGWWPNEEKKAKALSQAAHALAQVGDRKGVKQALAVAEKMEDKPDKSKALFEVAEALIMVGDRRRARATAKRALDELLSIRYPALLDRYAYLGQGARVLFQAGEMEGLGALLALGQPYTDYEKYTGLIRIVLGIVRAGATKKDLVRVLPVMEKLAHPKALCLLAHGLAQAGDREHALYAARQARELAQEMKGHEFYRAEDLCYVSHALARAGDHVGALAAAQEALPVGREYKDFLYTALTELVQGLQQAGHPGEARRVARDQLARVEKTLGTTEYWLTAWIGLVHAMALVGDRDQARRIGRRELARWDKISYMEMYLDAWSDLLQALHAHGDTGLAIDLFRWVLKSTRTNKSKGVFDCIKTGATLLVDVDRGRTVGQIYQQLIEVNQWWSQG